MSTPAWIKNFAGVSLLAAMFALAPCITQGADQVWGYKVRPGDRLVDIAKTYKADQGDWQKLQKNNGVGDPQKLAPGKQINIPVGDLRQGNPFAEAALVHGDVERISPSGQTLAKLVSGDVLKMGDTVRTAARSTLTIRFADDSRMLVTESSKVTLSNLVNYGKTGMADTRVKVHEGGTDSQVTPQKGPVARYEVNTPSINLAVRGTEFRTQVNGATGAARTEVTEGRVAGDAEGAQTMIAGGFGIMTEPGKPLGQVGKLLEAPILDASPPPAEKLPRRFAWQPLKGAEAYRLQLLAIVQGDEALIVDESLKSTQLQWDAIPDGDYVLRVRGVDSEGLEGRNAVLAFQIGNRPEPPVLELPLDKSTDTKAKTIFRWSVGRGAENYHFQLALDADFKKLIASVPNIAGSTPGLLLAVPEGRYYWRVASVGITGTAGAFSAPFSLTLKK